MIRFLLALLCLCVLSTSAMAETQEKHVILFHGIAMPKSQMAEMADYLKDNGYTSFNIGYDSRHKTIEKLIVDVRKNIKDAKIPDTADLYFVGFSLGSLITRAYITKYKPKNLKRVVMLGPPNKGSEVADFLKDTKFYHWVFGPAGQQLITDQTDITKTLGTVDYELGIIAGRWSIDPISSFIIPGDDDGKVSVKNTKIKGMKDHMIVNVPHTLLPYNDNVQKQTLYFLENGKFKD